MRQKIERPAHHRADLIRGVVLSRPDACQLGKLVLAANWRALSTESVLKRHQLAPRIGSGPFFGAWRT